MHVSISISIYVYIDNKTHSSAPGFLVTNLKVNHNPVRRVNLIHIDIYIHAFISIYLYLYMYRYAKLTRRDEDF